MQNVEIATIVKIILAACMLYNVALDDNFCCAEHPDGCPRMCDSNE